ncbi:MAG: insulinase family protein [Tissierellia bacterium]|nr:insulinase family protein [Tissierellia bacterium]
MKENYLLVKEKWIEELKARGLFLKHKKTGAQVLLLDNKNENKTFAIGFRTPPEDSTGVAHIVEHSVLSGSRKYRTKEPFMDMIQSSMQTFLNAMTYPDKTLYPISSRNTKDFLQLMDVYLDAVFYPRMYELKEVFLQEGHHQEIHEGVLSYNGVVYNEMKGVYGDPINQVSAALGNFLHPKGTYSHDSGGDPRVIPSLTYEAFLDFHRRYYHPSNAYIFLAGDLDFDQVLDQIDRDYLSHFDYQAPKSDIVGHPPFKEPQSREATYSISQEEYREDKAFFALAWDFGPLESLKDQMLRAFLADLLVQSEGAPLKTRLLEAGIGEDVYVELSTSNRLDFTLYVHHAHPKTYPDFLRIVKETLEDLVKEGIDKEELAAVLNKFEFSIRQGGDAHKDLLAYIQSLGLWLYGQDPLEGLEMAPILEDMRSAAQGRAYEDLIQGWFLDTPHRVQALITPQVGKGAKEDQALAKKLAGDLEAMKEEEVQAIRDQQEALFGFQLREDTPEAKATIPRLDLTDVEKAIAPTPREEGDIEGIPTVFSDQPTNGIHYLRLAFDISHLDKEELFYASLLSALLGRLATGDKSYAQVNKDIFLNTGGIQFSTPVYSHRIVPNYTPYMLVSMATLENKMEDGLRVLEEIMTQTRFDQAKRNQEALLSTKTDFEASILSSGHSLMADRLVSYFHEAAALDQWMNNLDFYFNLAQVLGTFNNDLLEEKLRAVYDKVFLRNKLTIHLVSSSQDFDGLAHSLVPFLRGLKEADLAPVPFPFSLQAKNEGFSSSSSVQYVSQGFDLGAFGQEFTGDLRVLASILSSSYLHNQIRAKGGAYGAGVRISRTGALATYSYRDPKLKETLGVYRGMGDFIRQLDLDQRALSDFIIGTMNSFDPHLSPLGKAKLDFSNYLNGIDLAYREELKDQALSTSLAQLKDRADLLDQLMEKDFHVVMGNEDLIKKNKDLFKTIRPIFR